MSRLTRADKAFNSLGPSGTGFSLWVSVHAKDEPPRLKPMLLRARFSS
jgi:hypothetical protein